MCHAWEGKHNWSHWGNMLKIRLGGQGEVEGVRSEAGSKDHWWLIASVLQAFWDFEHLHYGTLCAGSDVLQNRCDPALVGLTQCYAAAAAAAKSLQSYPTLCNPRQQPIRLSRPWDSPGKNTGVGCHFLLQCMKVKSESEVAQSCPTLSDPTDGSLTRLLCPWDFPGKSTGVACHCLLRHSAMGGG